jgi:hypothetical protein
MTKVSIKCEMDRAFAGGVHGGNERVKKSLVITTTTITLKTIITGEKELKNGKVIPQHFISPTPHIQEHLSQDAFRPEQEEQLSLATAQRDSGRSLSV